MKPLNLAWLLFNFIKGALLSGWDTARVILFQSHCIHGGMTRMAYGELSPAQASLLGALITLTPGTTTVAIDLDKREFLLHLLDLTQRDATLASITHDFVEPFNRLKGDIL